MAALINRVQLTAELNFRMDEAIVASDKETVETIVELNKKLNEIFGRDKKLDSEVTLTTEELCAVLITALSLK